MATQNQDIKQYSLTKTLKHATGLVAIQAMQASNKRSHTLRKTHARNLQCPARWRQHGNVRRRKQGNRQALQLSILNCQRTSPGILGSFQLVTHTHTQTHTHTRTHTHIHSHTLTHTHTHTHTHTRERCDLTTASGYRAQTTAQCLILE